jgi:pimeloyl-ACP methyl ester carboxylesterase
MKRSAAQSSLRLLLRRCSSALAMALALLSAPLQPITAEGISFPRYQRPGQLVDIGTHRLHIYCLGSGSPAVILDAGLGGSSLEWLRVQSGLSGQVRACIYDRGGYGWSDPGPAPRTSSRIADELFLLLYKARIPGPYVLVGHSFGGYNVQLFASRYPYATQGLVLVDSSHAEQLERFQAAPIRVKLAPSISGDTVFVRFSRPKVHPMIPDELKGTIYGLMQRAAARRAMAAEYLGFRLSAEEVRRQGDLPDVPTFVLTRGQRIWGRDVRGDLMEKLWFELQGELARRVPRHAHVVAVNSGHYIHLDQPQLVINAVRKVIEVTRQPTVVREGRWAGSGNQVVPSFNQFRMCSYTF